MDPFVCKSAAHVLAHQCTLAHEIMPLGTEGGQMPVPWESSLLVPATSLGKLGLSPFSLGCVGTAL